MARGNNARDRYMYGICTNRDNGDGKPCPKCAEKTIQQIRAGKDFVCEECGENLTKVAPPRTTNWALIGGIAAAVIVLGGGGAYFAFSGEKAATETVETVVKDTIASSGGSLEGKEIVEQEAEQLVTEVEDSVKVSTQEDTKSTDVAETVKKDAPTRINLPYGYFEGPTNGSGKPNGIGIDYVTKGYSLDLKNRDKETLDLKPGDKIMNAKFKDGNLQQGELQRKDGTRKTIQIGG